MNQLQALSIAENYLGSIRKFNTNPRDLRIAIDLTIEKPYGWIFTFENKTWVETRCDLDLTLGFSHHVYMQIPVEVKIETRQDKGQNPIITLSSADKQLIGQVAAKIRSLRKPEPYKGKGIRYSDEVIRRKQGKRSA